MSKTRQTRTVLVTGATGLLGSHVVERLVDRGNLVRALVRPGADTRFLKSLGGAVELIPGDLTQVKDCRRAVSDSNQVIHCASKVGDWGTWKEFQSSCVDATANLASAASEAQVERFLHISSTSAYGHPKDGSPPVVEGDPFGQNFWTVWDYYTKSKVEQERLLWSLAKDKGLRLTVIRPSWLYGERDRTTTARLVQRLRQGKVPMIGSGNNPISAVYAGNVADAVLLAVDDAASVGEAYNITDHGPITQRDYFTLWAEILGVQAPRRHLSYKLVYSTSLVLEAWGRFRRSQRPPLITRYATWLMGRSLSYSTNKARERLGWEPKFDYRESIQRTVAWYLERNSEFTQTLPPCV